MAKALVFKLYKEIRRVKITDSKDLVITYDNPNEEMLVEITEKLNNGFLITRIEGSM